MNTKKLKPGSFAVYNIWPGNGMAALFSKKIPVQQVGSK